LYLESPSTPARPALEKVTVRVDVYSLRGSSETLVESVFVENSEVVQHNFDDSVVVKLSKVFRAQELQNCSPLKGQRLKHISELCKLTCSPVEDRAHSIFRRGNHGQAIRVGKGGDLLQSKDALDNLFKLPRTDNYTAIWDEQDDCHVMKIYVQLRTVSPFITISNGVYSLLL
jgi:hypothetical protein